MQTHITPNQPGEVSTDPACLTYRESNPPGADQPLAVLISGGLDSAILLGEALKVHPMVYPITIRCGLAWEKTEGEYLARFLSAMKGPRLAAQALLAQPVDDLYGRHWSMTGEQVPDARSSDDAVFLPGRNVFLLAKAIVHCHIQKIPALAMAPLQTNPFPDATPEFFHEMVAVVNRALKGEVALRLPYLNLHKREVMRRGQDLPLELTFSCIQPQNGLHCGRCNKCAERRHAFADASMKDPTIYAQANAHSANAAKVTPCSV